MNTRVLIVLGLTMILALGITIAASGVSGAGFTTFNAAVDGASKDVCKNSAINCNIYGAKEYVWLNGGPTANGLGPDGEYFFAVLAPGGQPNPNDDGPKNLSSFYDAYTNRTFTVTGGEVSAYAGTHWFDSGVKNGNGNNTRPPDGQPPYIRLFPYLDTPNPGGVYIMAICSLENGYPVSPRDCKYDAFKVKKGKLDYQFMLEGMKFHDLYADGINDEDDPGLEGWEITIKGTGPDGKLIDISVYTAADGTWSWLSPVYTFIGNTSPEQVDLEVCEVVKHGWYQSYPDPVCYTLTFTPSGFDYFGGLDFGNYQKVSVEACKIDQYESPVVGWPVALTEYGEIVDEQVTGEDGCYVWEDLMPGIVYDVHEDMLPGWFPLGAVDYVFEKAVSGESYTHTFQNAYVEGCTPGFWQGGNDFGTAGGKWLWNEDNDPDWVASGGFGTNPYKWDDSFCDFFGCTEDGTMWYYVNPNLWSVNDDFHKAARSLTAAYLNASWGMGYPYSTTELLIMWTDAYNDGKLLTLHNELDAANNAYYRSEPPDHCPISASGY
jgi:hypothetical protein